MKPHVTELLGAYYDGELTSNLKQFVESHLAGCEICRAELESFRELSSILKTDEVPHQTSNERFAANLTLKLPRQHAQSQSLNALEIGWWLIPVGALGVWLFFQITFSLGSVVSTLSETGLLGNGLSWLHAGSPQARWFSMTVDLFGRQLGPNSKFILSMLNDLSLFVHDLTSRYIWQALFATLYLGWLIFWWLRQPNQVIPANPVPQS